MNNDNHMSDKMRSFIENNINLIDLEDWDSLFKFAKNQLDADDYLQLCSICIDVLDIDQEIIDKAAFGEAERALMRAIKHWLSRPDRGDGNYWSRFWWMHDGYYLDGVPSEAFLQYLLRDDVKQRLGLKMEPLEPKYSTYGLDGDYDLGWFDKKAYDLARDEEDE